jgi:hypothetical protein
MEKNKTTEDKQLLFNFYWKLFTEKNKEGKDFKNHPILLNRLTNLSEEYVIQLNKNNKDINNYDNNNQVKNIFYKGLIPLDFSSSNYLFMKYIKFHINFNKFNEWFTVNEFDKIYIDENIMREYLMKNFLHCLNKNKNAGKGLNDYQLISNICVKERLTLYNFLIDNNIPQKNAKYFINGEYMKVIRGKNIQPDINDSNMKTKLENFAEFYYK